MPWDLSRWQRLETKARGELARARSEQAAWRLAVRFSRRVLRAYSSSFFLVTRFLPRRKREQVEVIYASVRYPDEIVDTFPLPPARQIAMLDAWEHAYLDALRQEGMRTRAAAGIPWILAAFADVVHRANIPAEHYRAFLDSMRRDARPALYPDLESLIADYVYGSAIVVGYFLTHVYGPGPAATMTEALDCARELGIALQLTNFARDVFDDRRRNRLYLPLDMLSAEGLTPDRCHDSCNRSALRRAVRRMALSADAGYNRARRRLGAFAPDCRAAIGACIEVYGALNRRFLDENAPARSRVSLSAAEKFRVLPADKYWRVPLAYAGLL